MTKESAAVEVYQTYKLVHLALLSSEPLLDVIRARGLCTETLDAIGTLIFGSLKEPRIEPNAPLSQVEAAVRHSRRTKAVAVHV